MFNQKNPPSPNSGIVVDIIPNTISENGDVIQSEKLDCACQRAYELESDIYHLDPSTFGLKEFKKAFLGTNKLESHPHNQPPLPYHPEDIKIFNNGIFIFQDREKMSKNKDIAYFTALCFFKKNEDKIESIHIRFLAGIDASYRGMGFHYAPLFRHVFTILQEFSKKYPDQNPEVNVTQFAMVSPGTPGAIINAADILSGLLLDVSDFKYGDDEAIKMASMFGLRELLDSTGKANINMKVRVPTLYQNKNNKGASAYDALNLKEGEGITGRQQLGRLKDFLAIKDHIESALHPFASSKSAHIQSQLKKAKL